MTLTPPLYHLYHPIRTPSNNVSSGKDSQSGLPLEGAFNLSAKPKTFHPDEEHKPRLPDSIAQPIANMPLSRMENTTFAMPSIIDTYDMGFRTVFTVQTPKRKRPFNAYSAEEHIHACSDWSTKKNLFNTSSKVLDESRSFFRVHTCYFSNIPKCIKAEFIASWACSQSSVVSSSKR
ncbi:hypothetical protein TNCV_2950901 [Trichonephila clavipes]|nr:hypothetical protein TNCV_2950901 [Trichonephila clavipes]